MSETLAVPAVGSRMADIELTDATGATSTLDALRGDSTAVLFFMRASSCAICLGHVRSLLALPLGGARAIIIAPGGVAEAADASARSGTAVWASGDAHAEVGLGKFLAIQHSGTFLVDADGTVLYAKTSTLPMGAFSKAELLEALAA